MSKYQLNYTEENKITQDSKGQGSSGMLQSTGLQSWTQPGD